MAGVTKDMYPEGTVATTEGFLGPNGEVLLGVKFTKEEVNNFNGTSSDLPETGDTTTSDASPETEEVEVTEAKPASAEHHRYKNDSQLARSKGQLIDTMKTLEMAIEYRSQNSAGFFNNGDKAGTGELTRMHDKLKDILDNWDENIKYYGM